MLVGISHWRKGWRTVAFLWRNNPPDHRRIVAVTEVQAEAPTLKGRLFRLCAAKVCGAWFRWRATQDPLAALIESAEQLDYGAGRFNKSTDQDD